MEGKLSRWSDYCFSRLFSIYCMRCQFISHFLQNANHVELAMEWLLHFPCIQHSVHAFLFISHLHFLQNANHVELAMEWLFANPEAAAAAEASTAQQQGPGDDEQLAAMVADALSAGGKRLGMLEEVRQVGVIGAVCTCKLHC